MVSCRNKWFCKTNNSNCFRIIPFTQFVVPTWNIISNVLVERRKMRVDVLSAVAALLFLTILYYIEDDTKPIIGFIMVAFVLYHVCCPQGIFYQYFKLRFKSSCPQESTKLGSKNKKIGLARWVQKLNLWIANWG